MHPHNDLRGQNHPLAVYGKGKRTWTPRSIMGHLQHNWDLVAPCPADLELPDGLTSFVWGAPSRRRRAALGRTNQVAIGAPWLYLQDLDAELLEPAPQAPLTLNESGPEPEIERAAAGSVVFVEHGIEGAHLARRAVRELQTWSELGAVTVALDAADFAIDTIRTEYETAGFAVHDLGPERNDPGTDQPRFLHRLLELLRDHERLVSNSLRTELLYAGSLEMPAMLLDVTPSHRPLRLDLLPVGTSPRLPIAQLPALADDELGRDYVLRPSELNELLEWTAHA